MHLALFSAMKWGMHLTTATGGSNGLMKMTTTGIYAQDITGENTTLGTAESQEAYFEIRLMNLGK